jgi:hypothetical protein
LQQKFDLTCVSEEFGVEAGILLESPADAMHATLNGIDSDYGNVRRFLIEAASVSPDVMEALQADLIGPEPSDRFQ